MHDSATHSGHKTPANGSSPHLPAGQPVEPDGRQGQPPEEVRQEGAAVSLAPEWERVCKLAIKQLDRCVSLEPKVLHGDDPDAIHDLRVATRRLQQVLDLLFPAPHSGEIRKLRRRLRRCRRSLSEVRNYDVLLDRVNAALARKRTARRAAWESISGYLKESRSTGLDKALRKLTRANLPALYVRLKECLPVEGNPLLAAGGNSHHLCAGQDLTAEQFYARISEGLKAVWGAFEQEVVQSRRDSDPAVLHRTRIAAKRVRYLIEVVNAFEVPGSKEALVWLRSLQRQLGNWHDLVVFEEAVIGMIAAPTFLRDRLELAMDVERLILRNRALKAKLEKKYREMTTDRTGFFKTKGWVRRVVESPAALFAESG
ncbi:MAG: CHAD domain-containing protein [Acidobacteriota bacterium]